MKLENHFTALKLLYTWLDNFYVLISFLTTAYVPGCLSYFPVVSIYLTFNEYSFYGDKFL